MSYGLTVFFCKANFVIMSSEYGTGSNMKLKLSTIYRATLATHSGNEGWIGVEPGQRSYHAVVPVDVQISRGVMACNKPTDGTPFGGYAGWIYFRCAPYDSHIDDETLRLQQAKKNLTELIVKLSEYGIVAEPDGENLPTPQLFINTRILDKSKRIFCSSCNWSWNHPGEVLSDTDLTLVEYLANFKDFRKGIYLFEHICGGRIELPVSRLLNPHNLIRSLAGLQACPGLCFHSKVLAECRAECEGSLYRKVAGRIVKKQSGRVAQKRVIK